MAKAQVLNVDNIIKDLDAQSKDFRDMAGRSLYQGARIMADSLREHIEKLPERPRSAPKGEMLRGVTAQQKQALLDHMGIAKMQNNSGSYDIKIGFYGYDDDRTPKYPKGHPISMIARAVESGTSFLQKTPFIRPTYQSAHAAAESAMQEQLERDWSETGQKQGD